MLRVFTDSGCLEHRPPAGFPERRERLEAVLAGLRRGPWEIVEPSAADVAADDGLDAAVDAIHAPGYARRLRAAVARGDGLIDSADNPLSAGTWTAARAAVRAALAAADWMMAAPGRSAFVATRPPGHHAERDRAMGFCYFNNVAVAAEHLLRRHGLERLAILDFDVHHGNGTQHLFEERGDVFYASVHQYPFYPGTGAASETGRGPGSGATLNVPLPAGSGDEEYRRAFGETLLPGLEGFAPEALLVSAGFDAWRGDPLGGMRVSVEAFGEWGRALAAVAAERCGGRMLSLLEGGYDLASLGDLAASYLDGCAVSYAGPEEQAV